MVTVTNSTIALHTDPLDREPVHMPHPGADINRRRLWAALGTAAVIAAGVTIGLVLSHQDNSPQPVAYTNISRNFKACLLTTTADQTQTMQVWHAVQAAARHRPINAQHVLVTPGTTSAMVPYLNSLLSLHCGLIITAEPGITNALTTVAKDHPQQSFANLSGVTTNLANIQDLPDTSQTHVAKLLTSACQC
jgi:basic membrane lipoprotein Med (substrate-binding protein (PBP1-ABC) superfamily)